MGISPPWCTIAFLVLPLNNRRVGSHSYILLADHGGHPVYVAVHDEKKHEVQLRLLKMLPLPNKIQMRVRISLQTIQLCKLNNFLLMKTLMLQLNKLANLPQLLNKFPITKSN